MEALFSKNRTFKRIAVNILSIFVILVIAFANTGFWAQAAQRTLPGDWDVNAVRKASVLHEEGGYKMWYDGVNFFDQTQIGLATSEDGISWTKYYDNPVLTGGSEGWDSSGEHGPFVMKDGDLYKMWYEGFDGSLRQLGYATSSDGITWTKYEGNPVLKAEPGYDQDVAGHGSVLYEDGLYKLWYHAIGDQGILIAYATSPDGINWTKEGPVLLQEAGIWDENGLWGPSVLKVEDTYRMWYSAGSPIYPASIGAATSPDGINWTRIGDAPVITIADNHLGDPHVIFEAGIFRMWFNNFSNGKIYYAESPDGIQWDNLSPALTPGVLFPLEGWHDGSYGEVDPGACAAFGWSADPDNRDRDVQIRVFSDGEQVAEGLAQDYGEDMEANNICPDGTCRFTVNLWDLISHDEEHEITVQAYDEETADWWDLEGTPKSLTCQTPVPRVYANLPEDGIRYEYSTPGASVNFSIYDSPDGNLLWEGSRTADDSGFVYLSIWDHRVDLKPGMYIVASDDMFTKQLLVEPVSLDVFDPVENIMQGTAAPNRTVWVVANNESVFCGTNIDTDADGNWAVDFDDYGCDPIEDMWAYAQVMDAEEDTSEANLDFIDGWHAGNEGVGHANTCNASGFVLDTDDRSRDLEVRILSDGGLVTTTLADQAWSDLQGVCGEDGSCGFYVNLWGLISTYEEHQITVQARDLETDKWHDIWGTPRALTCVNYDIYAFNPETGEVEQITALEDTGEYDPSWSPNGRRIVHDVADAESHALYITDVRTHISTPLPGGENGNDAAWSWNGRWIAFDRRWIGEPNIYIVPAEGGDPLLVRNDAVRADWAPNSKRLVFQQPSDGSIWTVAADGGKGPETFIAPSGSDPAWSPDGNWIAYELNGNLWKVQVNIQGTVLDDPIQVTHLSGWSVGAPTWSLDSRTITFNGGIDNDMDIWKVPAAGGAPVWLTGAAGYGDYGPENARNSLRIAYASPLPDGQAARYWMTFWSHDPAVDIFGDGEYSYQYHVKYTVPEEKEWDGVPLTVNVTDQAPIYDGYALLGPWIGRPQQAWTGSVCEAVDALNPDQPLRFVWGWVNDYPMTYEEAQAHFNSFTIDVSWDGASAASGQLAMGDLVPYNGQDTRFNYLCNVLAEHP